MQPPNHSEPAYTFPGYFPPGGESRIFPSFYDRFGRGAKPWTLPHPDEIRKRHAETPIPPQTQSDALDALGSRPKGSNLFVSPDNNSNAILVKWGPGVSVSEAIALLTVDAYIGRACPVPTVYGWFVESSASASSSVSSDGKDQPEPGQRQDAKPSSTFIYMSHVPGPTLAERYPTLTASERGYIARQLRKAVGALRSLRPAEGVSVAVGTLERKGVGDRLLREVWVGNLMMKEAEEMGVFEGVGEFHDFIAGGNLSAAVGVGDEVEERRRKRMELNDGQPVGFCHADFGMRNVILTGQGEGPVRVKAVVGWEGAGFYPVGWEGWKARLSGEWEKEIFEEAFGDFGGRLDGVWEGYDFFFGGCEEEEESGGE